MSGAVAAPRGEALLKREVRKQFAVNGAWVWFSGSVRHYNVDGTGCAAAPRPRAPLASRARGGASWYNVVYDDGDEEDLTYEELLKALVQPAWPPGEPGAAPDKVRRRGCRAR